VHDDKPFETRRMKSAGRVPAISAEQYEKMRSQTEQAYDHEEHMKRLAAYATPKKASQNEHKFDGLVESAGVPSNCSPYMYFQLRQFLRFPSANSTQKASYIKTREGFGKATKYNYESFKYPEHTVTKSKGAMNMTEEQNKEYLKTREQFRKTHHEAVFGQ